MLPRARDATRIEAEVGNGMVEAEHCEGVEPVALPLGALLAERVRADRSGVTRGERFAVLLAGRRQVEALTVLDRARVAVGGRPLALGPGLPCPIVTISGGVAVLPADGSDGATLVHKADAALYAAKRAGRNQVQHA